MERLSIHGLDQILDLFGMSREEGRALMQRCWGDMKKVVEVAPGASSGLIGQKSKRLGLVQHPQFSFGFVRASGIHIDAPLNQVAMKVGDQCPGVPGCEAPTPAIFYVWLDPWNGGIEVGVVDAVHCRRFGVLHVGMGQEELSNGGVKSEPIHPATGRIHQHGGAAVKHISRSDQVFGWLKKVRGFSGLGQRRLAPMNAEDGANTDVHIDIG